MICWRSLQSFKWTTSLNVKAVGIPYVNGGMRSAVGINRRSHGPDCSITIRRWARIDEASHLKKRLRCFILVRHSRWSYFPCSSWYGRPNDGACYWVGDHAVNSISSAFIVEISWVYSALRWPGRIRFVSFLFSPCFFVTRLTGFLAQGWTQRNDLLCNRRSKHWRRSCRRCKWLILLI